MIEQDGPVRGKPWTRRESEPELEYAWFLRYAARPPWHRHPNHVAAEVDTDPALVRAAARRWRWSPRARARDAAQRAVSDRRAEAVVAAAAVDQVEVELGRLATRADRLNKRTPRRAGWVALIGWGLTDAADEERERAQRLREGDDGHGRTGPG